MERDKLFKLSSILLKLAYFEVPQEKVFPAGFYELSFERQLPCVWDYENEEAGVYCSEINHGDALNNLLDIYPNFDGFDTLIRGIFYAGAAYTREEADQLINSPAESYAIIYEMAPGIPRRIVDALVKRNLLDVFKLNISKRYLYNPYKYRVSPDDVDFVTKRLIEDPNPEIKEVGWSIINDYERALKSASKVAHLKPQSDAYNTGYDAGVNGESFELSYSEFSRSFSNMFVEKELADYFTGGWQDGSYDHKLGTPGKNRRKIAMFKSADLNSMMPNLVKKFMKIEGVYPNPNEWADNYLEAYYERTPNLFSENKENERVWDDEIDSYYGTTWNDRIQKISPVYPPVSPITAPDPREEEKKEEANIESQEQEQELPDKISSLINDGYINTRVKNVKDKIINLLNESNIPDIQKVLKKVKEKVDQAEEHQGTGYQQTAYPSTTMGGPNEGNMGSFSGGSEIDTKIRIPATREHNETRSY